MLVETLKKKKVLGMTLIYRILQWRLTSMLKVMAFTQNTQLKHMLTQASMSLPALQTSRTPTIGKSGIQETQCIADSETQQAWTLCFEDHTAD